jgi:glycosyltransferase involved in cell wall biosynthesis
MKKKLIRVSTVPESLLLLLRNQLRFLNEHYEVIGISSPGPELNLVSNNEDIEVIPLKMYRRISIWSDIISIFRMYKILKKEKPFIIHSITPKAGLVSMIAGYFAGVPHRIHTFTGLVFPAKKGMFRFLLLNIDRIICLMSTIIIPEGEGVKNDLIRFKVTNKKLNVIANGNVNGIDLTYFKNNSSSQNDQIILKKDLGIKEEDVVITFIGRIVVDKGIEELVSSFIELFNEIKNIKLLLVGSFEKQFDHISIDSERLISSHPGIIHKTFQPDIRPYLSISNIFVLPSYREGFPNVVMQAGAMDLPCVVTDINGSNEIIINNVNGVIIPSKNTDELKVALKRLILNPNERNEMAKVARQQIVQRFDQNLVWSELLKMYNSLN